MSFGAEIYRKAAERVPGTADYRERMKKRAAAIEVFERIERLKDDPDFKWWRRNILSPFSAAMRSRILDPKTSVGEILILRGLLPVVESMGADLEAAYNRAKAEAERLDHELRREMS